MATEVVLFITVETLVSDAIVATLHVEYATANGVILRAIVATNGNERTKSLTSKIVTVG